MRRSDLFPLSLLCAAICLFAIGMVAAGKGNVDKLRFGTSVNAEGVVPEEGHGDHFNPNTPIHVSMQVQEAPQGTEVLLDVLDRETKEVVWSSKSPVPGGHANMHFVLADLQPGKYRAKVKLGDDWVAEHEFKIE